MKQPVAPAGLTMRTARVPGPVAFGVADVAFVLVFVAAGTPIPLFLSYRVEDGMADSTFALASVGYFCGAAGSLLFLGRLSDHVGRKPVMIAALVCCIAGTLVQLGVHSPAPLVIGRILQGLACGLVAGSLGAYVIDTSPARSSWLPAAITGSAPMLGIPLGALSGVLSEYAPAPRTLVYVVVTVALLGCAVILAFSTETVTRTGGGALAALRPRLTVLSDAGGQLSATGAAFVATWCIGAFCQAFAPSLTAEHLGSQNILVAAAVFSSVIILAPLGGPLAGSLGPTRALRFGLAAFVGSMVIALFATSQGAIVPFLAASLVASVAQGTIAAGGTGALLALTGPAERAGLLSTVYLVSYSGAALPALVAGSLAGGVPLTGLFSGYVALSALAALTSLIILSCLGSRQPATEHPTTKHWRTTE